RQESHGLATPFWRLEAPRCQTPKTVSDTTGLTRFPVEIVQELEPGDDSEAAEEDLVRARVPADVGRVACAVGEIRQPGRAGAEGMRYPRPRRAGDDVAGAHLMGLARLQRAGILRVGRLPQLQLPLAMEDDEELLLDRVAVRRRALLARGERDEVEAGQLRARGGAERARAPAEGGLDVVDVHDRRRPLDRRRPVELLVAVVRMLARPRLGPRRPEPVDPDLREVRAAEPCARAVREHVHPL